MGGSRGRVCTFAKYAAEELKPHFSQIKDEDATTDLAKKAGRFVMFKVGPILVSPVKSVYSIIRQGSKSSTRR